MGHRHAPRGPVKAKNPMESADPMDGRCTATNRRGERCGRRPIPGGYVCKMHGGAAPQVIAKAEERLEMHYPKAVRVAGELLDAVDFPTVQAQMVKFIVEHKDGRPTERVDANINMKVDLVDVLRQRHARHANSLDKMAPAQGTETDAGAG